MTNAEKIGLAKNRFISEEVQMAIAKSGYRRACSYLATNDGLAPSVRDYIWSDDCNRGYTLKYEILSHGHYKDSPDRYREYYNKFGHRLMLNSSWRLNSTLMGGAWRDWYQGWKYCPTDVLDVFFEDFFSKNKRYSHTENYYSGNRMRLAFVQHPNCSMRIAIELSTFEDNQIKTAAFQKIVELS